MPFHHAKVPKTTGSSQDLKKEIIVILIKLLNVLLIIFYFDLGHTRFIKIQVHLRTTPLNVQLEIYYPIQ